VQFFAIHIGHFCLLVVSLITADELDALAFSLKLFSQAFVFRKLPLHACLPHFRVDLLNDDFEGGEKANEAPDFCDTFVHIHRN